MVNFEFRWCQSSDISILLKYFWWLFTGFPSSNFKISLRITTKMDYWDFNWNYLDYTDHMRRSCYLENSWFICIQYVSIYLFAFFNLEICNWAHNNIACIFWFIPKCSISEDSKCEHYCCNFKFYLYLPGRSENDLYIY